MGCRPSVSLAEVKGGLPEIRPSASLSLVPRLQSTTPVLQRRRDFHWVWSRSAAGVGEREGDQWVKFSDVENEMVEDAFNGQQVEVQLDGNYRVDLQAKVRWRSDRTQQTNRIERLVVDPRGETRPLRADRFVSPVPFLDPQQWTTTTTTGEIDVDDVTKMRGPMRLPRIYQTLELEKKTKTMADLVDDAARGIVRQGDLEGRGCEARWLAAQLVAVREFGVGINALHYFNIPPAIGQTCIYLHSKESFWYKFIFALMKNPDAVSVDQVKTIGPFCHLLHWFMKNASLFERPASLVYRSLLVNDVEPWQQWQKSPSLRFVSFTSTTKDRTKAEALGNALLIIDLKVKEKMEHYDEEVHCGTDLSSFSAHPHEDEFLIWPGTDFSFLHYEFQKNKNKHLIFLHSSRYTYL